MNNSIINYFTDPSFLNRQIAAQALMQGWFLLENGSPSTLAQSGVFMVAYEALQSLTTYLFKGELQRLDERLIERKLAGDFVIQCPYFRAAFDLLKAGPQMQSFVKEVQTDQRPCPYSQAAMDLAEAEKQSQLASSIQEFINRTRIDCYPREKQKAIYEAKFHLPFSEQAWSFLIQAALVGIPFLGAVCLTRTLLKSPEAIEEEEFISPKIVQISTKEELKQVVQQSKGAVFIDFHPSSEPLKKMFTQLMNYLAEELDEKATICRVDGGSDSEELLSHYQIERVPTLISVNKQMKALVRKESALEIARYLKEFKDSSSKPSFFSWTYLTGKKTGA